MSSWLRDVFSGRPWWMNVMMAFFAFMTFFYMPWDIFWKPVSVDREVWFGYSFYGWNAKLTAVLHWWVYAALLYGFRRMRPWARIFTTAYVGQVAFGMWIWSALEYGSMTGFLLGLIAAAPYAALTSVIWNAKDHFRPARSLAERYGEWALITGASSGIGAEFARAIAAEDVSCVLTARGEERLVELAADLRERFGVGTRVIAVDLAASGGPGELLSAVEDLEISILVNNAGAGYVGRFDLQDAERLRELIDLNCVAPAVLANQLLPAMRERRRGAVIFTGSISGVQPIPLHAVYSATKVFEHFLAEALWVESREAGVDVLVVEPGSTSDTDFQTAAGQLPHSCETPSAVVKAAFEVLGRQPSVITTWFGWARAEFATRVAPRNLVTYIARGVMRKHTPPKLR